MSKLTKNDYCTINGRDYIYMHTKQGIDRIDTFYFYDIEQKQWFCATEKSQVGERVKGVKAGRLSYSCGNERHPKFKKHFMSVNERNQQKKKALLEQSEKSKKKSSKEQPFKWKISKI